MLLLKNLQSELHHLQETQMQTTVVTDQRIKLTNDHQDQQLVTASIWKFKTFPFNLVFIGSAICSRSRSALIAIPFHRSETNQSIIQHQITSNFYATISYKLNASFEKPNRARVPSLNPKQSEISPLNGEVVYDLRKMFVSTQRRELL